MFYWTGSRFQQSFFQWLNPEILLDMSVHILYRQIIFHLPSFLSAGLFGGSKANENEGSLCVLCVSAVKFNIIPLL
jgi:hypothetical protein